MKLSIQARQRFLSALSIVVMFLLWELICRAFNISDLVLPKPSQVFKVLIERMPALMPHATQTLFTTTVGFAFGVLAGIVIGVIIGYPGLPTTWRIRCWWAFRRSPRWRWCRFSWFGSAPAPCRRSSPRW